MPAPKNQLQAAFQKKLQDMINIYKLQADIKGMQKKKDQERNAMHMSRHEYFLYKSAYRQLQKEADKEINQDDPRIRYRNIYLQAYEDGDWKTCNIHEIRLLKKRKKLQEWILESDLLRQLMEEAVRSDERSAFANERFMNLLLNIADVKKREVPGSQADNNLSDIITD